MKALIFILAFVACVMGHNEGPSSNDFEEPMQLEQAFEILGRDGDDHALTEFGSPEEITRSLGFLSVVQCSNLRLFAVTLTNVISRVCV
ncbi:uncharacterized protein LOC135208249 isoform X2 [Macrobrachium nipponense]